MNLPLLLLILQIIVGVINIIILIVGFIIASALQRLEWRIRFLENSQ